MRSSISATFASRSFSAVLDRVEHGREEIVVERAGEPVCAIVPVFPSRRTMGELAALVAELGPVDAGFARDVRTIQRRQGRTTKRSVWDR